MGGVVLHDVCPPRPLGNVEDLKETLTLEPFATKLKEVLMKNPGFDKIHKISKVLRGSEDDFEGEDPNLIAIKANAPVVTCDVERTFSLLKDVNSAKRWNLTEEHIKEIRMIQWNHKMLS